MRFVYIMYIANIAKTSIAEFSRLGHEELNIFNW